MKTPVQQNSGAIQAVFEKPATMDTAGMRFSVDLTPEDADKVREVATRCGMEALSFTQQYLCRTLPGQTPLRRERLEEQLRASDVAFACFDPVILARLERAARFKNMTLDEYVAHTLAFAASNEEDDMIVHPETGEPVGDAMMLTELPGFMCPQMIAPPLGRPAAEWLAKYPGFNRVFQATDVEARPAAQEERADEPGGYRGSLDVPATEDDCGWHYEIALDPEDAAFVRGVAQTMGMDFEEFVCAFLRDQLPRQDEHRRDALPKGVLPQLDFVPAETIRRLQRAAKMTGSPLRELVLDDLDSTVKMYEEDMIFHPQTGEVVADRSDGEFEALRNPVSCKWTTRPLSEQRLANAHDAAKREGGA